MNAPVVSLVSLIQSFGATTRNLGDSPLAQPKNQDGSSAMFAVGWVTHYPSRVLLCSVPISQNRLLATLLVGLLKECGIE